MLDKEYAEDLRAARAGDRAAMNRLLEGLRPWLDKVVARFADWLGPDASCDDIIQETSLQAWLKLAQFTGNDGDEHEVKMFCAWMEKIVNHLCQNHVRRMNAQCRSPADRLVSLNASFTSADGAQPPAPGPTVSSAIAEAEASKDVRAAIASLPDATDRLIVHECFFAGRSLRDLADELKVDRETVRRRFHAILDSLRQQLRGHV